MKNLTYRHRCKCNWHKVSRPLSNCNNNYKLWLLILSMVLKYLLLRSKVLLAVKCLSRLPRLTILRQTHRLRLTTRIHGLLQARISQKLTVLCNCFCIIWIQQDLRRRLISAIKSNINQQVRPCKQ